MMTMMPTLMLPCRRRRPLVVVGVVVGNVVVVTARSDINVAFEVAAAVL